jgi:hypothetical protein
MPDTNTGPRAVLGSQRVQRNGRAGIYLLTGEMSIVYLNIRDESTSQLSTLTCRAKVRRRRNYQPPSACTLEFPALLIHPPSYGQSGSDLSLVAPKSDEGGTINHLLDPYWICPAAAAIRPPRRFLVTAVSSISVLSVASCENPCVLSRHLPFPSSVLSVASCKNPCVLSRLN